MIEKPSPDSLPNPTPPRLATGSSFWSHLAAHFPATAGMCPQFYSGTAADRVIILSYKKGF